MEQKQKNVAQTELEEELFQLRQHLKDREKRKTGRTPQICPDDSLREIARLMPRKASDFYSIPGIGPSFVENFSQDFLNLLSKHTKEGSSPIPVNRSVEETLRELSKKLININRNNRMLFLPRLSPKYAIDLFPPDGAYNPLDILFGENKGPMTVADVSSQDLPRTSPTRERYRQLVGLIRETVRDMRDKGQNDLYIGYPFVQGNLVNGEFGIRAPLCLFPVVLDRSTADITVQLDSTRDIIYNGTLILAHDKFNSITTPLPDCVIEELDPDTFLQSLLDFYKENDIRIEYDSDELKKFKEYPGDTFPHYTRGTLKLVHNIIIGKFPAYANSIQRDFDEILDKGLINRLVADLISDYGATDFYSENTNADLELNHPDKKQPSISEHSLVYINALNSAQEAVLHAAETMNELVVEGPPGTGKSQTITSLITQFVNEGKNVLMVSEKKTALDVVYSRLGTLSRYAMMMDDSNNKNLFYTQLERLLFSNDSNAPLQAPDLSAISAEIDTDVATLEVIADKLFTPGTFGVEPYMLYMESRRINLQNHEQIKTYKTIRSMMTPELLDLKYDEVAAIHKKFANGQLTDSLDHYQLTIERYPWFLQMKDTLSQYDLILFSDSIDELILKVDEWRNLPFLKRQASKNRLTKEIQTATKDYFNKNAGAYTVRLIMEQPEAVKQSLKEFTAGYANLKPVVTGLTKNETLYLTALRKIHKICGGTVIEWNDELYNTMLFEHIQRFEMENRTLMPQVASFEKIISSIEKAIHEKQGLAKQRIAKVLADDLQYITASKRKGEINRAIESRRRASVAKFVKKFDFELFKAIKIWLMTPEAVSEVLPQQNDLFDLLIFDEASQLYVEKSIPSIIRAKKVVIAGDHKQLRPSSLGEGRFEMSEDLLDEDAEISAALEEESLLDLARFRYPDVLLNTHYRSKYEELIDFSNYAFYKGRLFVAPNTDAPEKPPIEVHLVDNAVWQGRANRKEAERIVKLIKEFFQTRQNNETIGVIAFNASQRDMIYDVIDEESLKDHAFGLQVRAEMSRKDNGEDTGLFIKNIESVQGDERDVIMFSIGYAKNTSGRLMHNFGWLNQKGGENRLNVAISRAKQKIHIVTSFRPSELMLDDAKNEGPRILKRYLEYAFAVSNNDKEDAERILQSFGETYGIAPVAFETEYAQKVANALREKGYDIDTQVGIGGYRIDIAVRKNGRYVLGIECDGKLYSTAASARERDYHRQKYLESRGWRIKRIWSMDWWRDPQAEIASICALVDTL
ncbi:MAG: HRDC domain-containing protein [Clostridia bacterium]|nr:HRDC domain-containing protein [Clostridia bacterium]